MPRAGDRTHRLPNKGCRLDNPRGYTEVAATCSCGVEFIFFCQAEAGGSEPSFGSCPRCPERLPVPGPVLHTLVRKDGRWEPAR
jgi:hypothetical protein